MEKEKNYHQKQEAQKNCKSHVYHKEGNYSKLSTEGHFSLSW